MEQTITITIDEYKELILKGNHFDIVLDTIYDNAMLNYNGKELTFETETVRNILKVLDYEMYQKVLKEKQAQEADNE